MKHKTPVPVFVVTLEVGAYDGSGFEVLEVATTLERAKELAQQHQLRRKLIALVWSPEGDDLVAPGSSSSQYRVTTVELDRETAKEMP